MNVIVCVGETEEERDAGKAEEVVAEQLDGSLPQGEDVAEKVTVAYEPVWAIGTGPHPDRGRYRRDAPPRSARSSADDLSAKKVQTFASSMADR